MPTEPRRRYFYFEIYVYLCLLLYGGTSVWEALYPLIAGTQTPSLPKLLIGFLAVFLGLNGLFGGTFSRLLIRQSSKVPVLRTWLKSPMGERVFGGRMALPPKPSPKSALSRAFESEVTMAIAAIILLGIWCFSLAVHEFQLIEMNRSTHLGGLIGLGLVTLLIPSKYDRTDQ